MKIGSPSAILFATTVIFIGCYLVRPANGMRWPVHDTSLAEGHRRKPMEPVVDAGDLPANVRNLDVGKMILREKEKAEAKAKAKAAAEDVKEDSMFGLFDGFGDNRDASPTGPDTIQGDSKDVCMSKNCVHTAANMLENMNSAVKPCDDFYRFVCGTWIRDAIIPETSYSHSYFAKMTEQMQHKVHTQLRTPINKNSSVDTKAKIFFESCMDEKTMDDLNLAPLFKFMADLDISLPMINRFLTKNAQSPSHTVSSIMNNLFADTGIFGLDMINDPEDSRNKYLLHIYQPNMFLRRDVLVKKSKVNDVMLLLYRTYLTKVLSYMRDYLFKKTGQMTSDQSLEVSVGAVIAFEIELAKILQENISIEEWHKKIKFSDFKKMLNQSSDAKVDLAQVTSDSLFRLTGIELNDTSLVNAPYADFFSNISRLLDQVSTGTLIDYLVAREILTLSPATTDVMRLLARVLREATTGIKVPNPRWKTCVDTTISYFGAKVSKMLIDSDNGEVTRNATLEMVQDIKDSFKKLIQESKWMDADTIENALSKLSATETVVVYNERLRNRDVEAVYKDLGDLSPNRYLQNLIDLKKFWVKKIMNFIKEKPHFEEIEDKDFDTSLVNAVYSPSANAIWIPLGILHYPMYRDKRLATLNYGAVGSIIGHELSHGFDNNGAKYDKNGNYKDWWSDSTLKKFQEKQKCFIKEYGNFTFDILKTFKGYNGPTSVNGKNTLGENIADNAGLREAYFAYQSYLSKKGVTEPSLPGLATYNPDQLFFMSYVSMWCETKTVLALAGQLSGDPHPPHSARVAGVLGNMPEFAKAFSCPAGSNMVPNKTCKIW